MRLNAKKCMTMDICFNKTSPSPVALQLNDCVLKQHNVIKLLGVYIQADLKWDVHVAKIISKASSRLYILRRLKHHGLPYSDLLTVYLSIVRPLMEYATPVWAGGITKKQEEDIERIQKRACQIILGKEYTGYTDARDRLHLITLITEKSVSHVCPIHVRHNIQTPLSLAADFIWSV